MSCEWLDLMISKGLFQPQHFCVPMIFGQDKKQSLSCSTTSSPHTAMAAQRTEEAFSLSLLTGKEVT